MRSLFKQQSSSTMNHTSLNHLLKHLENITIVQCLCKRQWSLLEAVLTSEFRSSIAIDDPSLPTVVTADMIIHCAVRARAPLSVITLLASLYPQSLCSPDMMGRYPIHVAAKWASNPSIIAYLVKTNPSVVGAPDSDGKTPMHYVGECYVENHSGDSPQDTEQSMGEVVDILRLAAPHSVNLEDNDEMNAVEYALINNASMRVIKKMQRACRDDWRERSNRNPDCTQGCDDNHNNAVPAPMGRRRHDDLVKDIENMAYELHKQYMSSRGVESKTSEGSGKIHVHRSSARANIRVARTA
jgi:hypothetical protein